MYLNKSGKNLVLLGSKLDMQIRVDSELLNYGAEFIENSKYSVENINLTFLLY